jgi:transcription elongation factor
VIGVGVKSSTSDLLIANCDEFIYYDDLVRKEEQRRGSKKPAVPSPASSTAKPAAAPKAAAASVANVTAAAPATEPGDAGTTTPGAARKSPARGKSDAEKKQEAFDLVLATIEALGDEREADEKIWGSMIKQALKRQRPGFNESYHGFRSFNQLLEEARDRKLLELEKDEKSGGYVVKAVT